MKWQQGEESTNVEDRRGTAAKTGLAVGGGGALILLIGYFLGVDPAQLRQLVALFGGGQQAQVQEGEPGKPLTPEQKEQGEFTSKIFKFNEVIWQEQFKKMGKTWRGPKLVLFDGQIDSACGAADASVGPFYCPGDEKVYIDLSFYRDMESKLKAGGEFARAYVIAHEMGHHVQRLLGYPPRGASQSGETRNQQSVRLELQADYLAGVWAHYGQEKFKFLENGDIESAMNAANQIGDDKLQQQAQGRVRPDSFTHGTSKQRVYWFKKGFQTGDVKGAGELFTRSYDDL